jgi:hypothetical protein
MVKTDVTGERRRGPRREIGEKLVHPRLQQVRIRGFHHDLVEEALARIPHLPAGRHLGQRALVNPGLDVAVNARRRYLVIVRRERLELLHPPRALGQGEVMIEMAKGRERCAAYTSSSPSAVLVENSNAAGYENAKPQTGSV